MLQNILSSKRDIDEYQARRIAKSVASLSWEQLDGDYKEIHPPRHMEKFDSLTLVKPMRYHLDQTLCLFRMSPIKSQHAIYMKNRCLESMFDEIAQKIEV